MTGLRGKKHKRKGSEKKSRTRNELLKTKAPRREVAEGHIGKGTHGGGGGG